MLISSHILDTNKMVVHEEEMNGHEWGRYREDKKLATYIAGQRKQKTEIDNTDLLISLETQSSWEL